MKRVAILLAILIAVSPCTLQAQMPSMQDKEEMNRRGGVSASERAQTTVTPDQPKQLSIKIGEGEKIVLRNRFGPIVVTGIGGDNLEASVSLVKQPAAGYQFRVVTNRFGKDTVMVRTSVTAPEQALVDKYREDKTITYGQGSGTSTSTTTVTTQTKTPPAPRPTPGTPLSSQRPSPTRMPRPGMQGTATRERPPRTGRTELTEASPPEYLRGVRDIRLEVKLPRNARIEMIDSRRYALVHSGTPVYLTNTRNDVSVTNMATPISIVSSGEVQVSKVGPIEVKTRAGNVQVREVSGPVNIQTVLGSIVVKDAEGDVRAVSISGPINVDCARGRTEATTTNGTITLTAIGGDLDASTTGGTISFTGAIRDSGRYRLKSMSGLVRMLIQKEPPGFMTSLSSYKGQVISDFELKTELSANTAPTDIPTAPGQIARRVIGRYGEGDARITLDSFSGTVQLGRAPSEVWKKCQ